MVVSVLPCAARLAHEAARGVRYDAPRMPPAPPLPPKPPFSALAVASAVVLIVPFLGPLVSIGLAGMALARIRRSSGRLRGRFLARGVMVFGLILLLVQVWALESLMNSVARGIETRLHAGVEAVLASSDPESAERALGFWSGHGSDRASDEELLAFAQSARERYGAFRSLSTMSGDQSGSTFSRQIVTFAAVFRFEREDRLGSVTVRLEPALNEIMPAARLIDLSIEDRERGELRLGPAAAESAVAPDAAPSAPSLEPRDTAP